MITSMSDTEHTLVLQELELMSRNESSRSESEMSVW